MFSFHMPVLVPTNSFLGFFMIFEHKMLQGGKKDAKKIERRGEDLAHFGLGANENTSSIVKRSWNICLQ